MPGDEDIRLTAKRIEELNREIHEGGLSIDETLRKAEEALALYREFRNQFATATFDVAVLERSPEGELVEKPFRGESVDR
ncbi:MAG: hypothetical protein V1495_09650 [Pseudomonadota bacterium]